MLQTGSTKKSLVSIVVPAYKQEKTIRQDIENIYSVMSQTRWEFEIVVVVDGHVDSTFEESKRFIKPNVLVYGYEENKGKGYAVRYGMEKTRGDVVAFIDAGMDINPNGISMVLEHMEWYNADVIVGSKRHPVSKINYPFFRKLYSFVYHDLVRTLFGIKVRDTQTGLKVFKRSVLAAVLPRLLVKDFAFDVEILAVCNYLGFSRIFEAPIEVNWNSENTNFTPLLIFDKNIRFMIRDTLAVFYRMYLLHYYADENRSNWLKLEGVRPITYEMGKEQLKFSIVIPVRAVNPNLEECLSYIKKLTYENFEVIVVADLYQEHGFEDDRFKLIFSGAISPGEKRNLGAEVSEGDILAFLDDDAYPAPDWLSYAKTIFSREATYALGGPAITPEKAPILEKISGRIQASWICSGPTVYRYVKDSRRHVKDYPSVNLFIRREAFLEVGGFTKEFWPGEDTKLCLDLYHKFGKGFVYDPNVIVYHHRRELFSPFLMQISRYGKHRGQFARILPETSRLPGYFIPSLFVLGLFLGPILVTILPFLEPIFFYTISLYLGILVWSSFLTILRERSLLAGILFIIGVFETNIIYGTSFLIGFIKKPQLELRKIDHRTGGYLGG